MRENALQIEALKNCTVISELEENTHIFKLYDLLVPTSVLICCGEEELHL